MSPKKVFVTVGTTSFSKLIDTITTKECIHALIELGYTNVQLQTGGGFSKVRLDPHLSLPVEIEKTNDSYSIIIDKKLTLVYNVYFPNFHQQIVESDLVISHAGAGTCLEVLKTHKPLVVVINEDLMNNHQMELAEELQKKEFLYYTTCDNLNSTLRKDFSILKKYPEPEKKTFSNYLARAMGFS